MDDSHCPYLLITLPIGPMAALVTARAKRTVAQKALTNIADHMIDTDVPQLTPGLPQLS